MAKIKASLAMFEASGVKIGTGLGPLGLISGHPGPRLVALESRGHDWRLWGKDLGLQGR